MDYININHKKKIKVIEACKEMALRFSIPWGNRFFEFSNDPLCRMFKRDLKNRTSCNGCPMSNNKGEMLCIEIKELVLAWDSIKCNLFKDNFRSVPFAFKLASTFYSFLAAHSRDALDKYFKNIDRSRCSNTTTFNDVFICSNEFQEFLKDHLINKELKKEIFDEN